VIARGVAAVPVDHQHRRPVRAGVAAQLDQQEGERLGSDRQCAGEPRVLAARAERHRGSKAHTRAAGAGARRDRHRDPGVGIHGQVRPVLF
jgi:hypothetical protein